MPQVPSPFRRQAVDAPANGEGVRTLNVFHRPRPAADWHIRVIPVHEAVLHTHFVADLELSTRVTI